MSTVWYNYLDDEKFVQERRVGIIKNMIKKFQLDFQQSLEVVQANISLLHYPGMSLTEFKWLNLVKKQAYKLDSPLLLIPLQCKQFCMRQGMVILI